jgi:hypothetical protein
MNESCPRCGESVVPTSWSVATPETQICDACSEDEAVRDVKGLPPVQPDDWPVTEKLTFATAAVARTAAVNLLVAIRR